MSVNKPFDEEKVMEATKMLLEGLGEDITRPGLVDTPKRVTKYWRELSEGSRYTNQQIADMFRKDLYKVLKNAYDDNKLCIFDPLCMTTSNGSCCACSFLDEVACEHFNKDLSRRYLFGYGKPGEKEYVKNFWGGDE